MLLRREQLPRELEHGDRLRREQLRVGEALRHALSDVLERGNLRDPAFRNISITVTEVRASPDLKNATAFVMPLGGEAADAIVEALGRAAPFLRSAIAKQVELRHVPRLQFKVCLLYPSPSPRDKARARMPSSA